MLTSSTDNHLFFLNARISTGLQVLGHIGKRSLLLTSVLVQKILLG